VNVHHKRMILLLGAVAVLIVGLGALYGYADPQVGTWDGMYFAVVTVTTVGYGDIIPRGWEDHLVALAIMVLIIPLWTGVFSLLTTGLITREAAQRHEEMKQHVDARHTELKDHIKR
jgi:voltage-gated potassium channel